LAPQLCARGRKLNVGWKLRYGQAYRNRFDKLIPKQKPTGSTEVPDIVLEAMRVKEIVEMHLFCRSEGVNENLEEELGPELAALSSKE